MNKKDGMLLDFGFIFASQQTRTAKKEKKDVSNKVTNVQLQLLLSVSSGPKVSFFVKYLSF